MNVLKVIALFLFCSLSSIELNAHGGGLDSSGGHHNRKTGGYHYHRGVKGNFGWIALAGAVGIFYLLKSKNTK